MTYCEKDHAEFLELWAELDGRSVLVEFYDGTEAIGVWQWRGQTANDFYLVYINTPEGQLVVGTDARNFKNVTRL